MNANLLNDNAGAPVGEPNYSKCQRCNRPLTSDESRRVGYGPICRGKVGASSAGGSKSERQGDTLPPANATMTVQYEGYHQAGAFATVRVYRRGDVTLLVATDESETHGNTSVTNRVERVMYLAWERIGKPENCHFAEHYRGTRGSGMFAEELDFVDFQRLPDGTRRIGNCYMSGRFVGPEFERPEWVSSKAMLERYEPVRALIADLSP